MSIRTANVNDTRVIRELLDQLGYRVSEHSLKLQLLRLLSHSGHTVLVYEHSGEVCGFVSAYLVPSLAIDDGLMVINYLAVEEKMIGKGVGKALEQAIEKLAWEHQCDRVQLHCRLERERAHGFYKSRGYKEYPVFYNKRLIYAE